MALTLLVNGTNDTPRAKPGDVRVPDYDRREWRHVFPPDVDWHLGLTPGYWIDVLPKLAAGDRIECCTSDYEVCIEIWVQEVVSLAQHLKFIARALFPAELVLPAVVTGAEPRYFPRQGQDRLWDVVDRATGSVMKTRVSRGVADMECEVRNSAQGAAEALVAKRAAGPEPLPEPATDTAVEQDDRSQVEALLDLGVVADLGDTVAVELAADGPGGSPHAASPEVVPIDEIDDLTGRPVRRSAEDIAATLAALGRAEAEQPQPKEIA